MQPQSQSQCSRSRRQANRKLYLDAYKCSAKRTSIYLREAKRVREWGSDATESLHRHAHVCVYMYLPMPNANDDAVEVGAACFMPALQL